MMRTRSGKFRAVLAPAVAVLIALLVPACGSSAPKVSQAELFKEYTRSTDVKNDKFPSGDVSSEDRIANFAAYYTPSALMSTLLAATPCDGGNDCSPGGEAGRAVREFTGTGGKVYQRSVLARHESGSLELVTLYVARRSDRSAALVDSDGRTYKGGLDDFRRHNDLLGPDDVILTLRDITSTPGKGKIVTVSGHTPPDRQPWLIGGIAVVAVAAAGALLTVRARRRRGPGLV